MRKIMAEKLVDNEIARLTYVEQGLGHSDEGDRTRRLRDALLIVAGRDPEFDGPMAEMVARHVKRVGKAGRVIAELSCGATLREMTPDLAAGTAEEEACGGAGEGAGGVDKGWVLVCGGRCVYRHGLACAERVRKALDADAVRREQAEAAKARLAREAKGVEVAV